MFRQNPKIIFLLVLIFILTLTGCSSYDFSETGTEIISADTALNKINDDNVVLVDAQKKSVYMEGHVDGAVNIERESIVVSEPYPNMLAPDSQVQDTLESAGISNETAVIVYDNNNNMDAARLWWTLKVYGHENVQVVSGGLNALKEAGAVISADEVIKDRGIYEINEINKDMIASLDEVKSQLNEPKDRVKFLDVRTQEEVDAGTIPTSLHMDYINNNYSNGEYRSLQDIQIMYIEENIQPDDTIIMYCKTSIRAAQTYLALYNAGYRNLKLYDGAWLEYSSDNTLPIQYPEEQKIQPNQQDNS